MVTDRDNNDPVQLDMRFVADRPVNLTLSVNSVVQVEVITDSDDDDLSLPLEES